MAIQRPVFQIDGEDIGSATRTAASGGGIHEIVSVTGPGIIEAGGWLLDQTPTTESFATEIALEMVVDGVEIFDEFIDDADAITDNMTSPPFSVNVTAADDTVDVRLSRPISFKTSFILRIRNDAGTAATFVITGAMHWTKGV